MNDIFELKISGLAELATALGALGRNVESELAPVVEEALHYLWQELPGYPPKPQPGEAAQHWTAQQRRWFFAHLRSGQVETPYKRRLAGGLGGSVSVEVRSVAGEIQGVMGPNMPYARWVIGRDTQAALHAGRWWIFEDEIEKHLPEAVQIIEAGVARLLAGL